jgi:hypothetical protein
LHKSVIELKTLVVHCKWLNSTMFCIVVLVRVLKRNRANRMHPRRLTGIGSLDYEG